MEVSLTGVPLQVNDFFAFLVDVEEQQLLFRCAGHWLGMPLPSLTVLEKDDRATTSFPSPAITHHPPTSAESCRAHRARAARARCWRSGEVSLRCEVSLELSEPRCSNWLLDELEEVPTVSASGCSTV